MMLEIDQYILVFYNEKYVNDELLKSSDFTFCLRSRERRDRRETKDKEKDDKEKVTCYVVCVNEYRGLLRNFKKGK